MASLLTGCGSANLGPGDAALPVSPATLAARTDSAVIALETVTLRAGWNAVGVARTTVTAVSANPSIAGAATWNGSSYTVGPLTPELLNASNGGVYIYATEATSFVYSGDGGQGGSVDLKTGYNLVSFHNTADLPGSSLTATINGQPVAVASAVLPNFLEIDPQTNQYRDVDVSAGGVIRAGRAYWVYSAVNARLASGGGTVPSPTPVATPTPTPTPSATPAPLPSPSPRGPRGVRG
jgi:hypothetical protein